MEKLNWNLLNLYLLNYKVTTFVGADVCFDSFDVVVKDASYDILGNQGFSNHQEGFEQFMDWAKKYLDFCIENAKGDIILRGCVDNDDDGFNSMINQFLESSVSLEDAAVSIESPHQRTYDCFLLSLQDNTYAR